jgi:hypothetical protein
VQLSVVGIEMKFDVVLLQEKPKRTHINAQDKEPRTKPSGTQQVSAREEM